MKNENNTKHYIFDLSEDRTIKKAIKAQNIDWSDDMVEGLLYDDMFLVLQRIAKNMSLQEKQDIGGLFGINEESGTTLTYITTNKYTMPFVEVVLKSDLLRIDHNILMDALKDDNDLLSGFLNFENEEGKLDTILPGNALINSQK